MAYVDEVRADSPVGLWLFDETSGTVAADSSGNGADSTYFRPTISGLPGLITDGGTSAQFSGDSPDRVDLPIALTGGVASIEVWWQYAGINATVLVLWRDHTTTAGWFVRADTANISMRVAGTDRTTTVPSSTIKDGLPHHVVLTADGATVRLYIDGVLADTWAKATTAPPVSPLILGRNGQNSLQYVPGRFDAVAVYNTALSAARVAAHYAAGTAISGDAHIDTPTIAGTGALHAPDVVATSSRDTAVDLPTLGGTGALHAPKVTTGRNARIDAPTLAGAGDLHAPTVETTSTSIGAAIELPTLSGTGTLRAPHVSIVAVDYITATSRTTVRSMLADPVDVEYLTAESRTTVTSSAALSLDVTVNPSTKRPDYRLLLVDRHGESLGELPNARLGSITRTRNGTGSFSFSLDKDDPALAKVRQFCEVQVRIGNRLVPGGWFVITDPAIDNGSEWKFQCAGLRWHLASRRIGKELPELLRNGDFDQDEKHWHAKWFKGSAAEAPPHTAIVAGDKAMEGGKALEVTGVERVTRNSVQSDAIFIANRPYAGEPLANGFLPGGEKIIRDNIKNIAKGSAMTVEGHTADADAGDGYALSVRRAEAAKEVILKARPDLKVTAVGKGETEQVAPNNTEANQAKNRRLVIIATITSVGHRQAVTQRITYTQPRSARRPMELLLDARVNLIDYVGPSKDGWLLYIDRRRASKPGEINDASHTTIAEDFPIERWTTDGTSINAPADGQPWIFEVRLYPTAGKTRFDQVSLRPNIYTAWYGITRPEAIRNLVRHAQDAAFHKADLNISTNCKPAGPRSDFEYAWLDRRTVDDAISEELRSDSSPDFEIVVTDHRRIATTWSNRGRRTHVPLKLGDIVTDYSSGLDGDKVASTAIVQASRQRGSKGEAIVRTTRKDGLVLERLFDAEQGSTDTVVRAQARAALRYGRTDVIRSVTCDPDRTIWLMERIDLGDICPVQVDDGGLDGNGDYRIEAIALDPNRHQLTYQLAAEGA